MAPPQATKHLGTEASASAGAVGDVELESPGGQLQCVRGVHQLLGARGESGHLGRCVGGGDGVVDPDRGLCVERMGVGRMTDPRPRSVYAVETASAVLNAAAAWSTGPISLISVMLSVTRSPEAAETPASFVARARQRQFPL
jgi:hypothetical protein